MSLLRIEGFDDGATAWAGRAALSVGMTAQNGRFGTGARPENGASSIHRWLLPAADRHATLIVGFALNIPNISFPANDFFRLYGDNSATSHIDISFSTLNELIVQRGSTELGRTSAGILTLGAWHYLEIYVTLSDTVGVVKLRLDGLVPAGWSDLSGVDTKSGGTATVFDTVWFTASTNGNKPVYDDVYICNGAGSIHNDFLGDCRVETLFPNGNGNYSQLLGSDGNSVDNYLLVDEAAVNTTDYVGSPTNGQKDTYSFDDLALGSGTVFGVMPSIYAAKSDSGVKQSRIIARRAGVDAAGADKTLITSYAMYDQMWEQDPTDSSAWSIAKVNASEFGFEVRP